MYTELWKKNLLPKVPLFLIKKYEKKKVLSNLHWTVLRYVSHSHVISLISVRIMILHGNDWLAFQFLVMERELPIIVRCPPHRQTALWTNAIFSFQIANAHVIRANECFVYFFSLPLRFLCKLCQSMHCTLKSCKSHPTTKERGFWRILLSCVCLSSSQNTNRKSTFALLIFGSHFAITIAAHCKAINNCLELGYSKRIYACSDNALQSCVRLLFFSSIFQLTGKMCRNKFFELGFGLVFCYFFIIFNQYHFSFIFGNNKIRSIQWILF